MKNEPYLYMLQFISALNYFSFGMYSSIGGLTSSRHIILMSESVFSVVLRINVDVRWLRKLSFVDPNIYVLGSWWQVRA